MPASTPSIACGEPSSRETIVHPDVSCVYLPFSTGYFACPTRLSVLAAAAPSGRYRFTNAASTGDGWRVSMLVVVHEDRFVGDRLVFQDVLVVAGELHPLQPDADAGHHLLEGRRRQLLFVVELEEL